MAKKKEEEYLSARKAAKVLGVTKATILSWVKSGRLPGTIKKVQTVRRIVSVPRSALKKEAFNTVCVECGALFHSLRPERARFCCRAHQGRYHAKRKKAQNK